MKISYISDLHLDFWVPFHMSQEKWMKRTQDYIANLIETTDQYDRNVIVLAGDYSHFNQQSLWALEIFSQYYNQVFFTHGNHDMYLVSKNQENKYQKGSHGRIIELYEESLKLGSNIHPLFSDDVFTYGGVTFGGNPMWYPLSTFDQKVFFHTVSNDSRLIKRVDIQLEHEQSIRNYESMLNKGLDVMISHVPLCHLKSHELYGSTSCYFTPVAELPKYVIQGHSHERAIYKKAGTLLYMNCLGYPHDGLGEGRILSFEI